MKTKLLSILCALCVFFFLLTAAIGLPIYIRPFYYAHIEAFDLPARSGYTAEEIREACAAPVEIVSVPKAHHGMSFYVDNARYRSAVERLIEG